MAEQMMYYYKVRSSHWKKPLEFKSEIPLCVGECFRITDHDGARSYPTRFKVLEVSAEPDYAGDLVTILHVDMNVDPF